jgi:predicted N-formylglutamate amidohydrolase
MPGARRLLRRYELLISCEHGGNRVPARYHAVFAGAERALASHRGYDPGALELAREFARRLRAPLVYSQTSRLLIELNRSLGHRQSFSAYARRLNPRVRRELVARYYTPYRNAIAARVKRGIARGRCVVHLSCHSFTPRLRGVVRTADIGMLFDPRRPGEAALCKEWRQALMTENAGLRVRHNYPYRGAADGLTTDLRRRFGARAYIGIELEVNQKFPKSRAAAWGAVRRALIASFAEALAISRARAPARARPSRTPGRAPAAARGARSDRPRRRRERRSRDR